MNSHRPSRLGLGAHSLCCSLLRRCLPRGRGRMPGPPPPPSNVLRSVPNSARTAPAARRRPIRPIRQVRRPGPAPLKRWLENHKDLTPDQQEHELQNEPGFRELTPQMQQQELSSCEISTTCRPSSVTGCSTAPKCWNACRAAQQQYRGARSSCVRLPGRQRLMARPSSISA